MYTKKLNKITTTSQTENENTNNEWDEWSGVPPTQRRCKQLKSLCARQQHMRAIAFFVYMGMSERNLAIYRFVCEGEREKWLVNCRIWLSGQSNTLAWKWKLCEKQKNRLTPRRRAWANERANLYLVWGFLFVLFYLFFALRLWCNKNLLLKTKALSFGNAWFCLCDGRGMISRVKCYNMETATSQHALKVF